MAKKKYLLLFIYIGFCAFCLLGYLLRADFYFKQNDQFYYLALADSLFRNNQMLDLTIPNGLVPLTATSGVALLMFLIIKVAHFLGFPSIPSHSVFIVLSCFYSLLHLSSYWPLKKVLERFRFSEEIITSTLFLYFLSFPLTMFKLWPLNEGFCVFLLSWALYFIFSKEMLLPTLGIALFAPIFRPHLFFVFLGIFFISAAYKKYKWLSWSVFLMLTSIMGALLYRYIFPYEQSKLGQDLKGLGATAALVFESISSLFLSESIWMRLPKIFSFSVSSLVAGFIILPAFLMAYFVGRKKMETADQKYFFSLSFFVVSFFILSLAFSTVITARFLVSSGFFLAFIFAVALMTYWTSWAKKIFYGFAVWNVLMLGLFLFTNTTNANMATMASIRELSKNASNEAKVVYYQESLGVNFRQVYAYYRRPAMVLPAHLEEEKFVVLAKDLSFEERLSKCKKEHFQYDSVYLVNVNCSI